VTITWYEANAYCRWLLKQWHTDEEEFNKSLIPVKPSSLVLRLPTEAEWIATAGGAIPEGRFPWDVAGKATPEPESSKENDPVFEDILRHANVHGVIGRTTPVGMYPQGQSPLGVWDLGGNVWEWQANYSSDSHQYLALRGGSWHGSSWHARLSGRFSYRPDLRLNDVGFRVVALPR
jgi:formylglycine-generating enzyme required for sulfatase activity